ncbi:hypothetical protein [Fontibacillus sp. BL9]|uniref:hypothetical protein n=1 Tax=Fontibacillus sp. BL9 TaxID=3389971 RepID=UPI003978B62A
MNIKQIVIVGTMACVITVIPGISGHTSNIACAAAISAKLTSLDNTKETGKDTLIDSLGLSTDKALYDALLDGQSLSEIATSNDKQVDSVISLQTTQLQQQLTQRYNEGQLSEASYLLQMEEASEIISASAHQPYRILG